jgi:hypothetical protein
MSTAHDACTAVQRRIATSRSLGPQQALPAALHATRTQQRCLADAAAPPPAGLPGATQQGGTETPQAQHRQHTGASCARSAGGSRKAAPRNRRRPGRRACGSCTRDPAGAADGVVPATGCCPRPALARRQQRCRRRAHSQPGSCQEAGQRRGRSCGAEGHPQHAMPCARASAAGAGAMATAAGRPAGAAAQHAPAALACPSPAARGTGARCRPRHGARAAAAAAAAKRRGTRRPRHGAAARWLHPATHGSGVPHAGGCLACTPARQRQPLPCSRAPGRASPEQHWEGLTLCWLVGAG